MADMRRLCLIASTSLLWCVAGHAETNAPPVKDLGNGLFEIGNVLMNREKRTVTFPALVNMRTGLVEYVIVTSTGKTHESVLKTEAQPIHIHTAMLLLGVKAATTNDTPHFFDKSKSVPGDRVNITASWEEKTSFPVEQFVFNQVAKESMTLTNWIYNGSQTIDGKFLAQQDGSIVSLIADPSALVNNPRADRENDELWVANTNTVPVVGTAVQVKIEFVGSR
jgi:hypothetical protein